MPSKTSRRVSLKGKGADIFFGDYTPPNQIPEVEESAERTSDPTPPLSAVNTPRDMSSVSTGDKEKEGESDADVVAPSTPRDPVSGASSSPAPQSQRARLNRTASTHASTLASNSLEPAAAAALIEEIRKVVKVPGREVSFVRVTSQEKEDLGDIVHAFKRRGMKTSENEINRIALNLLLHDYHEHGERSVLARVLAALLA